MEGLVAGAGAAAAASLGVGISGTARADTFSLVNVRDHGVVGDGVTDDRDSIQRVIRSFAGTSRIYFPAGRYRIGSEDAPGRSRVSVGAGAHLLFEDGAVIEINSTDDQPGTAVFVAAGNDGMKFRLKVDALTGTHVVALPSELNSMVAIGDIVGFESEAYAPSAAGKIYRVRELHRVDSIDVDGVHLDSPLEYSYAISDYAVAWKIDTVSDIIIDGASFECGPGVTLGVDGTYPIWLSKATNFSLSNIHVRDMIGGLAISDSYHGRISNCVIDRLPRYSDSFSYGVLLTGGSARIKIDNLRGSDTRHVFTTTSDERDSGFWGGPMHIQVNNGVGYGGPDSLSIWDTHEFGRHIEFNDCHAFGGGPAASGFQIRSQDVSLTNCQAQTNGLRGVSLVDTSERVRITGGSFGYAGSQGISVAGYDHSISAAHIHNNSGAGIAFGTSANLSIDSCLLTDNLYGMQDGGENESQNAEIDNCVIPHSQRQGISILDLGAGAIAENLICLGYPFAGGFWNSAIKDWGAREGVKYSILTDAGWISNAAPS